MSGEMTAAAVESVESAELVESAASTRRIEEDVQPGEVPLRHNRRFQTLWIGGAGSFLGGALVTLGVPLLILGITGSAVQAGAFGSVDAAASLLAGLPAGMVLDRYNRRTLMIVSELVRVLAFASVVLALSSGRLTMFHLFSVAAVSGAARPFIGSARALATRAVVPPHQLTKALASEEVRTHTASIIGPSLGGVLFAVSRTLPLLGAVVGFAVSMVCGLAIPRDDQGSRERREQAAGGAFDGIKILMRDPVLRISLIALSLVNLGGTAIELVVVVLVREHGGSSSAVGLALALAALGGLLGSGLVTRLHRIFAPGWLLIALCLWVGAVNVGLVAPLGAGWYGAVLGVTMLGVPAAVVLLDVLIFRQVDDAVRGRTIGATMTLLSVGVSLGPLAAGLLLQYAGSVAAVFVFSGVMVLAGITAMSSKAVRAAKWPVPNSDAAADAGV
ncbi:MAG: MFS transporter [Actinocrinis sp.]